MTNAEFGGTPPQTGADPRSRPGPAEAAAGEAADARRAAAHQDLGEFYRLRAAGSTDEAIAVGRRLIEQYPEVPNVYPKLARLLTEQGDHAGAVAVVEAGLAHSPPSTGLLWAGVVAITRLEGEHAAVPYLRRLAAFESEAGAANLRLGEMALLAGDGAAALQAYAAAERAGIPADDLARGRVEAALLKGDAPTARRYLDDLDPDQAAQIQPKVLRLEATAGQLEKAKASGRMRSLTSGQLKAWAASRQGAAKDDRAQFVSEHGDILGQAYPGSRSALLVFGGLKDMVGAELPIFDRMIRPYRVNIVYLADPRRLLLMAGLPSFGDYRQTIEGLKELLDAWRVKRIYCMGFSAGGFAAISYGLDLGARRILTFAAPTELIGPVYESDGRARIVVKRVRAHVPQEQLDLRPLIQAHPKPPQIINYYGALMPQDSNQARHLEGLPNVSLRPLPGAATHAVVPLMTQAETYAPALAELLADAGPRQPA